MDGLARSSRRSGSLVRGHFLAFFSESYSDHWDCADVFDGAMIVLAMYTLNLLHPGIYLGGEDYPSQMSSEGTVMEERLKPTYDQDKAV
jgi:hypothetical protein